MSDTIGPDGGNPVTAWTERAQWYLKHITADATPEDLVDASENLLSFAVMLTGHGCAKCQGRGRRAYGSTSTWRGGIGGQAVTADVCDACWGSGSTEQKGTDQRALRNQQRNMVAMRELCARIITNDSQRADILRAFDTGWMRP